MGHPTIYPTGVTLYNPEKAYNGYTVMPVKGQGAMLIDMNGQEIKLWKGVHGFPNKIFPGGYLLGSRGIAQSQVRPSGSGGPHPGGLGRQCGLGVQSGRIH